MSRIRYTPEKVEVELDEEQNAAWAQPGGGSVRGVEFRYDVLDNNVTRYKTWKFAVRAPSDWRGELVVVPLHTPPKKLFSSLAQRPVIFPLATRRGYTDKRYCKLNLADPTGEKNKVVVRTDQRDQLPYWFKRFPKGTLRRTVTVRPTRGTDSQHLVCLVGRDNHERMIHLYFAMRVWVLERSVVLE